METVIAYEQIRQILDRALPLDLIKYLEEAFISYSNEDAIVPPVGTLQFQSPPGEVHIKYGYIKNESHYVVKIASGFYDNPSLGLPSGNGLNIVFSQETGMLDAILMDKGYLTDIRTALAGAVVAKHLQPIRVNTIGIVGTGIQARMQLENLRNVVNCKNVIVYGRSREGLAKYKSDIDQKELGFEIETTEDASYLAKHCNLIVTATTSKDAIIMADDIKPGTLIIAVGADTEGKQELDIQLVAQADLLVLDSTSQCISHGEIHKAYNKGLLENSIMMELGEILVKGIDRNQEAIIIADLTGIATQDMQISKYILDHI